MLMIATAILLSLILFGGVFVSSERFINVENDAKAYFVVISSNYNIVISL